MDAQDLVSDAIDKLSLVAGDEEEAPLSARLQSAISRITTLPTESEWNASQAQKEQEEEAAKEQADQQQNEISPPQRHKKIDRQRQRQIGKEKGQTAEYQGVSSS